MHAVTGVSVFPPLGFPILLRFDRLSLSQKHTRPSDPAVAKVPISGCTVTALTGYASWGFSGLLLRSDVKELREGGW